MSTYIKLSTLEYPRHEGDIRLDHPEIQEDQTGDTFPCPPTHAPVQYVAPPVANFEAKEVCVQLPPMEQNGVWRMVWAIRVMSDEEYMAAVAARDASIARMEGLNNV